MKRIIRVVSLLLAVLMLGGTMAWAIDKANIDDPDFSDVMDEETRTSVYKEKYKLQDFVLDEVVVTLKKGIKRTTGYEELFPNVKAIKTDRVAAESFDNGLTERQVIVIKLEEKSREAVLDTVELLKENDYVYFVRPNYIGMVMDNNSQPSPVTGDVNADGSVGNDDLILTARYVVNLAEFNETQLKAADMSGDGEVSNQDVIMIAKAVVGITD
ncbi:MAG: dockerin type I repeat-containing protein [Oscillospiraceae bacterium]|nr:dockerin type I repeat-containing protein [Oscillospiraceae bacterium]